MQFVFTGSVLLLTTASVYAGVDYARDVQPILASRCFSCHGPQRALGGLRLDDVARASAAKDKVIARVTSSDQSFRMPLGGGALSAGQVATLKAWASSPSSVAQVSTHWSFQPLHRPQHPKVRNPAWLRNAIDRFILARLDKERI